MFKCLNCGKEIDVDLEKDKKIICAFCGYRVLRKERPQVIRRVRSK